MMKRPDGKYQLSVRGDSQTYRVVADIRKNGDIEDIECNCPYSYGDYCKHEYAVLMYLSDIFESDIVDKSSRYTSMLITAYTKNAVGNAEEPVTCNYTGFQALEKNKRLVMIPSKRKSIFGKDVTILENHKK